MLRPLPPRAFFVLLLGLAGVVGAACFFGDDDEAVDFLERENAIIVQVLEIEPGLSSVEQRLTLPSSTLYGDGTLIRAEPGRGGGYELTQVDVPKEQIRGIVELMVGEGFLDFFVFEEPGVDGPDDATTTYLYLNTKQGVNSVRAVGLDSPPPEGASREHERLVEISEQLEAVEARRSLPYESDHVALFVRPVESPDEGADAPEWPLSVDLARAVEPGTPIGQRLIPAEAASALVASAASGIGTFEQGGLFFEVGHRPALPFEENFPEFDFP